MDAAGYVALFVGLSTAVVALIGYWNTQHLQRRDRRGQMYAEALTAMTAYEQGPYLVRRRADSSGATRAAIAAALIEANTKVHYSEKLLLMDSFPVGRAYGLLLATTRDQLSRYRDQAWATPVMSRDEDVADSTLQYPYDNQPEWDLCVSAMRRELALLSRLTRRDTIRRCVALAQRRAEAVRQPTSGD